MANYNDTTPAAPTGTVNIKFQSDASGNISAYDPSFAAAQTWTPTYGATGSMIITLSALSEATYLRTGPLVYFNLVVALTLGGTLDPYLTVSVPVPLVGYNSLVTGAIHAPGGNDAVAYVFMQGSTVIFSATPTHASGTNTFRASGSYRVA